MEVERNWMRICVMNWCILSLVLALQVGCASHRMTNQSQKSEVRNQQLAAELTNQATALLGEDPAKAKQLLHQALKADLYFGPAHNNLGVLHLQRDELYEAAEEFDWARRLMPGHPDPRINLGLALEQGGKIDDALAAYASALEVYPNHLPAIQALARCQIRYRQRNGQTEKLLKEIFFRGSAGWKSWAKNHLDIE